MRRVVGFVACLGCFGAGHAQDLVITNARIIDGTGTTIEGGSIVVTDGLIVSVSEDDADTAGDQIDVQGMTVMPGMIDTHVHLVQIDQSIESRQKLEARVRDELPSVLLSYLESGFTTVFSNGDAVESMLATKQSIDERRLLGPRLLAAGPILSAPDGHPASTVCGGVELCRELLNVELSDPQAARAEVRRLAALGVSGIKVVFDDFLGLPMISDDVLRAIAQESHRQRLRLFVHISSGLNAARAVELGADALAHPPTLSDDDLSVAIDRILQSDIPVSTTLAGVDGWELADFELVLRRFRMLQEAGIRFAFGTDRSVNDPAVDVDAEISRLGELMSPEEVIGTLTRNAAAYLGLSGSIGTLEPGKIADIVIIDGDPLDDISSLANVMAVIQGGRIVIDNR